MNRELDDLETEDVLEATVSGCESESVFLHSAAIQMLSFCCIAMPARRSEVAICQIRELSAGRVRAHERGV